MIMVVLIFSVAVIVAAEKDKKGDSGDNSLLGKRLRSDSRENSTDRNFTEKRDKKEGIDGPKLIKNKEFKARAIDKIRMEKARNNFLKAKANFEEAKFRYNNTKLNFEAKKDMIKRCKDKDSEECNATKEEIVKIAKEYVVNSADKIVNYLEQIKNKILSNEDLTEEESKELTDKIDAEIAKIEELKEKAQSAQTKQEIIQVSKELAKEWKVLKHKAGLYLSQNVNAKIGGIIVRSEQLITKLESRLEKLKQQGKDTSDVESLINQFYGKINESKGYFNLAKDKFAEARSGDQVNTDLIREAQELMKKARESLKDAHNILKDIVKSFKEVAGEKDLDSDEEDEAESDSDEEQDDLVNETADLEE